MEGLQDGNYLIDVYLEGGSGRASVTSPAQLTVTDQTATVRIEWSSSHYDYMIVEGSTYHPVNTEGNSVFEIPVPVFDEAFEVTADTTAMSTPHEITYTMTLVSASVKKADAGQPAAVLYVGAGALLVTAGVLIGSILYRGKRKKHASVS